MRKRVLLVSALLACCLPSAVPAMEESGNELEDILAELKTSNPEVARADLWTAVGTLAPLVLAAVINETDKADRFDAFPAPLILGGLFFGPSTGQFILGSPYQAVAGIGIRGLGAFMFGYGLVSGLTEKACELPFNGGEDCEEAEGSGGAGLAILGLLVYTGGVVYSIVDNRFAARRRHERLEGRAFELAPTLSLTPEGVTRTGILAKLRF